MAGVSRSRGWSLSDASAWSVGALGALVLVALILPAPAYAWTEAAVRSVRAEVALDADANARVMLTVDVRVHGGWLEGFELAGFDPDLTLDEEAPPFAVDEEGRRYNPRASVVRGGRILLAFRRSPRRGRLIVVVAYRTALAHRGTEPLEDDGRVRVSWRLPGWSAGLDGVQIDLIAPPGSRAAPDPSSEQEASVETSDDEQDDATVLRWRRAHLPRTVPWTVAADVPAEAMDEALRGTPIVTPPPTPSQSPELRRDPRPFWLALAAVLGLLALVKELAVRRLACPSSSAVRPLSFLPVYARVLLASLLLGAGALLGPERPLAAFACLAAATLLFAYRLGAAPPPSRLGVWRTVDARWLRASRRAARWQLWHPATLMDATTPLGAAHGAAWLTSPLWAAGIAPVESEWTWLAAVLALPMLLSGTRWAFPSGPTVGLHKLVRFTSRLRELPAGVALRPMMHVDVHGVVQEARVRVVLAERPRGILRLDLAVSESAQLGGYSEQVVLHAVTRAGSSADRALAERVGFLSVEESAGGRRRARSVAVDSRRAAMVSVLVKAFDGCPPAPDPARGTALDAETVRQLPAPSAVGF